MTDTMLERMARRIDPEAFEDYDVPDSLKRHGQCHWINRQRLAITRVKNALMELRKPTDDMRAAGAEYAECACEMSAERCFRAMIDAIE